MKHWKIISLFLFFSVIGLFFFLSPSHAQKKPIELTLSNTWPATAKHNILSVEWGKEIEKRTNGRVKVTVFPAGTLTSAAQCYQGTVDGLSDIGYCVLAYTRGRFPLTEVIDLPLGYNSGFEATKLINIFYNKFKPAEFDDIKMMYLHATSPSFLYTKKPVTKLEDLKGMKLVCSGMTAKVLGALGAVPVALPMIDRYDAIHVLS
jgi:TRAP-type C4-dicarboxylate transport system substrate-binding protein